MGCEKESKAPAGDTREASLDSDRQRDAIVNKLHERERSASEAKDRLLYLRADIDNFRKSADREIEELRQSGNAALLRRLHPIARMLGFAVRTALNEKNEPMAKGLEMISKQLCAVFEKFGMKGSEAAEFEEGRAKE